MADGAECFSVSDGMPEHPKIVAAGGDAGWLWVCALAYAKRNHTDGVIHESAIPRLSDRRQPMKLTARLVQERLMHGSGHDCKSCAQPMKGFYVLHDYAEWQGSMADDLAVLEAAEAAREAKEHGGAYGNHRRWHLGRGVPDPFCPFCPNRTNRPSLMRSETDPSSDGSTDPISDPIADPSSDGRPNRISDRSSDDGPSPSPQTPLPLPVDITPPTPPPAAKPKRRRQAYDYADDQDFLRFWDAYPQKAGKPAAYKAWLTARARGATAEHIIAAAQRYRDDPRRNPDHTKYPQGWLNDERYNDQPAAPRRPSADDNYWDE